MSEISRDCALARQLYADGHSIVDTLTETQLTHDRRMTREVERQVHKIERCSASNASRLSGITPFTGTRAYSFMNSLNVLYIFGSRVM